MVQLRSVRITLILIILLAALLRFSQPDLVPPSINWDEASLGYNAYSILKTWKDEWGKFLPINFEAFGDYKLPAYVYADVPFVGIFGLNIFSLRLPSQLGGLIGVVFLFLIVWELTENRFLALSSGFLLAISPWHIFLSRIAVEANLAFTTFLAGFYFFIVGLRKPKFLPLAALFWGITLFTYNSARVFIPLFIISLLILFKKKLFRLGKKLTLAGIIFLIFLAVAFYQAVLIDSNSRYFWVAIVDKGAISYLDQQRNLSTWPYWETKLIYNRYSYLAVNVVNNYLSHFSLDFLFLRGGSNYQFSLPGYGLLYIIELPMIILGILSLRKEKRLAKIVIPWLLLAPIPAAITRESPHALRAIFMLGSLQIISATGIIKLLSLLHQRYAKQLGVVCLILIYLFGLGKYLNAYFNEYPKKYSSSWQYGYQEVVDEIREEKGKVVVTKKYGEPQIFYLFYTQYDPAKYQNNPTLIRYARSNWRWVDQLDNLTFMNDWEIKDRLKNQKNLILVTSPGNYPSQSKLIKTIYFLDDSPAFDIVRI